MIADEKGARGGHLDDGRETGAARRWWVRWPGHRWRRSRRTERLFGSPHVGATTPAALEMRALPRLARRRWVVPALLCATGWLLVGGTLGVLVGAASAATAWHRRFAAGAPAAEARAAEAGAARQLPLAADLLAACVAAGASPVTAARAVGAALGGPVGTAMALGAEEIRLGAPPCVAWRGLGALPGAAPLARLLERAEVSGLPAAGPVGRLAAQARRDGARAAEARSRRAAVMISAPVGLCFLPAFITVGVLPVVMGLASGALEGGAP
ncbi:MULTISPECIES: type II secretion system F family protein [unclassified Streptomyces]|uniref:type II secretion system F family protein n=1 Tax=unclassified Streptomyces TaxID=2593676 RepID=UPI001F5BED38|nr:type II secretion system F family protein [Streptomyces sp. HSG2]